MIVQEISDGGLLLFRQTDHALLSGAFAAAWGNDTIPAPARRPSVLVAASRHDDGWAEWELAPRTGPGGAPIDFIHIPIDEHVALYKRGIDLVENEDAYAGLVASMHGERLYTRPFFPGMDPRIQHLVGRNLELATAYVEGEHKRQERLLGEVGDGGVDVDAEETWRLLQVWDRLSLLVCMHSLQDTFEQTLPPIATPNGDVQIVARGSGDGGVVLDPYPFAAEPATFTIEAFRTPDRTWTDDIAYRSAFRTAERVLVSFACRAG